MTNFESGEKLLKEAGIYLEELKRAHAQGFWNITVRKAQEVVELSLKGILKIIGVEYPKIHDPSGFLMSTLEKKGVSLEDEIRKRIEEVSKELSEKRAPAFYFDKEFGEEEASGAKEGAEFVYNFAKEFQEKLKKNK